MYNNFSIQKFQNFQFFGNGKAPVASLSCVTILFYSCEHNLFMYTISELINLCTVDSATLCSNVVKTGERSPSKAHEV